MAQPLWKSVWRTIKEKEAMDMTGISVHERGGGGREEGVM